ncbi:MAG: hypothetical protein HYT30_02410 [Parcubacteria group bacterium]|nr:hypothetical protein [Parcubacteria group bacterium]
MTVASLLNLIYPYVIVLLLFVLVAAPIADRAQRKIYGESFPKRLWSAKLIALFMIPASFVNGGYFFMVASFFFVSWIPGAILWFGSSAFGVWFAYHIATWDAYTCSKCSGNTPEKTK